MLFFGLLLFVAITCVVFVSREFMKSNEEDESFDYVKTPSYTINNDRINKLKERLNNYNSYELLNIHNGEMVDGIQRVNSFSRKKPSVNEETKRRIRKNLGLSDNENNILELSIPKKTISRKTKETNIEVKQLYLSWKENQEALDRVRLKMLGLAS